MSKNATSGQMKRTLTLTGLTMNAMAFIAPGAFLWTTFQMQSAQTAGKGSTAFEMWTGLLFAIILAMLTAYSYSELARIYPDGGTGSSYYYAEAAFLDKEKAHLRRFARMAKISIGWISHLYYWIYPGIMIAFTASLFGYIYQVVTGQTLSWLALSVIAIIFTAISGYIAFRGVSGSTNTAIAINVIQLTTLVAFGIVAIVFRLNNPAPVGGYEMASASSIIFPKNLMNLIYQSTIAILLLVGFESITAFGAEAKNPDRDIKRGVLLSLAIQGCLAYLFEYFAANYVIGGATIKAGKLTGYAAAAADGAPIGTIMQTIGNQMLGGTGQILALLMAFTVLLALVGTTLACLNSGVRITYAMSKDKEMPSILGLLHGKFATPHAGIWILAAVSAVFGIYGVKSVDALTQITLASNTGTFLVYGFTCLITIVAFASHKDKHPIKHYVIPGLGMLMNIAELAGILVLAIMAGGAMATNVYIALGIVVIWIVIGAVWVAVNPRMRGSKLMYDPKEVSA